MQRLIDANALMRDIEQYHLSDGKFQHWVEVQPTIDAEPVRHGKWELAEDGWYCSACEMYPPFDCDPEEKGIPYCPNCGARMGAEDDKWI